MQKVTKGLSLIYPYKLHIINLKVHFSTFFSESVCKMLSSVEF